MKFRNVFVFLLIVPLVVMVLFAGCSDNGIVGGDIPFDSARVQEHIISIGQATEYTTRFRASRATLDSILKTVTIRRGDKQADTTPSIAAVPNPLILRNAEYFNRDAIAALLNQAGPGGGIRIYLGQDANGVVRLVLVPATGKSDFTNRKLSSKRGLQGNTLAPGEDGEAIEKGQECPEMCPDNSVLNQDN